MSAVLELPETDYALSPEDRAWVEASAQGASWARAKHIMRAFRDPMVAIPTVVFALIVLTCFLGPIVFNLPNPNEADLDNHLKPFGTSGHLFGTNDLGADMLSRVLHGGQVTLLVGIGATAIGALVGSLLGLTAGYYGHLLGAVIMRIFDTLLAFPSLVLAMVIAASLGPSPTNATIAISFFGIATYGRLARAETLSIRGKDYVTAASSNGVGTGKMIFGHILPNAAPALLAYAMVSVGTAMLIEASLSYLGLGVRPPNPSWGNLISSGAPQILTRPYLVLEPIVGLFLTVLSLNMIGDGLRRRLALDR